MQNIEEPELEKLFFLGWGGGERVFVSNRFYVIMLRKELFGGS